MGVEVHVTGHEEGRDAGDADYARVAGAMPFVEGTLTYEIYREAEPS